jgi:hypothetical protein
MEGGANGKGGRGAGKGWRGWSLASIDGQWGEDGGVVANPAWPRIWALGEGVRADVWCGYRCPNGRHGPASARARFSPSHLSPNR